MSTPWEKLRWWMKGTVRLPYGEDVADGTILPLAEYLCRSCDDTWKQKPKILECPGCGSPFVTWTNYDEWKEAYGPTPCVGCR